MRRQHFTVGVDIDVLPFGLLEQHAQIFEIVAGNQNGFPGHWAHVDRAGLRIAVGLGFTAIEDRHHVEVHLANAHGVVQQGIDVARPGAEPGHESVVVGIELFVELAEHVRVFHIGRRAFQAIQTQQAQTVYVVADLGLVAVEGKLRRLLQQRRHSVAGQLQRRHRVIDAHAGIQQPATGGQRVAQQQGFPRVADDALGIEVDVGQGGEEGARGEAVDFVVDDAQRTRLQRPGGEALQRRHQQILQIRGFRRFAAHALSIRAAVACRGSNGLFTLHTEHSRFLLFLKLHL
ncbi:Uncharacterised protein [Acinetobacter baumannii]|nr:Uncharacterised protein [Acinetobacter baumannii]